MECVRRAICKPLRRRTADSAASLRTVSETVHNGAVDSTVRSRSGSQIARLAHCTRTLHANT
eukprot:10305741-Lingulodinium_polyedra.AAC.1